jgi:hypothetical protein
MGYQLGQVQGALYAIFSGNPRTAYKRIADRPPLTFRNQIKRLLDLDRSSAKESDRRSAFCAVLPSGSGNEVQYGTFDAFCLAIGLELVRFGFKQAEVVDKVQHIRPELLRIYSDLERTIETMGSTTHVKDLKGNLPKRKVTRNKDKEAADPRIFLVLDNLERPRETALEASIYKEARQEPQILSGWKALQEYLDGAFSGPARSLFMIELSEFSARLRELLDQQPLIRRGPKTD